MTTRDSARTGYMVLIAVAVIGLIVHSFLFVRYTVDDAYISFRYARNLADGNGLVFNNGERVEGYTNFLWTIVHSICIRAGFRPDIFAKGLGLASALGTSVLILKLAILWGHPLAPLSVFAFLLWSASGAVAVATMAGLETHAFTFLLTLGIVLYSKPVRPTRDFAGALLAMSVAALMRPEAVLIIALTLGHYYVTTKPSSYRTWPLVLPLSLLLPFLLWKLSYYGSPFPNTLSAKSGGGYDQLVRGYGYIKGFVNEYGKVGFYFLGLLPYLRLPLGRQRSYSLTILIAYLSYIVVTGGDWIPHYRFLLPILPLIYLSVQDGLLLVWDLFSRGRRPWRWWAPSLMTVVLAIILFDIANQSHYLRLHTEMWANGYDYAHKYVGNWLRDEAEDDETVALMDVGLIGYLSPMRVLDITGLTDPYIAAAPGGFLKKEYPLDYLFDSGPDYIVLVSGGDYPWVPFGTSFPIDRSIFHDSRFLARYEYLFNRDAYVTRVPHISGYYLLVFKKRNLND